MENKKQQSHREFLKANGWRTWLGSWWYKPKYPGHDFPIGTELHNVGSAIQQECQPRIHDPSK